MIALRPIARYVAPERRQSPDARCELCGGALAEPHRHVVELGTRGVQCACHACAILFGGEQANARYRTVPDRVRKDPAFGLTAGRWAQLGIPVSLAMCHRDSVRRVGLVSYPGPAGMTEAELEPTAWRELEAATPLAAALVGDVEALLVRGQRGQQALDCYLVPISTAYELVARMRAAWEGFTGGDRAEAELAAFFAELERRGGEP